MEGGEMVSPESALIPAISEPLERGGGEEGRREVGRGRTGGIKESMLRGSIKDESKCSYAH